MSTGKASGLKNIGHTLAPWALPVLLLAVWQLSVSAGWLSTRTALAQAQKLGLDLPVGRLVDSLFAAMVEAGDGELDHAGLIRQLRRNNPLPRWTKRWPCG